MMKFFSLLRRHEDYASGCLHESSTHSGVRFEIGRVSLRQRIELTRRVQELTIQNPFLQAGDPPEKLQAALADLEVHRLYLRWGLRRIEGLRIDGSPATAETLINDGPADLAEEIVEAIQAEAGLSEQERKNS